MRKFYIILAGILFTFLFTTCKQFTADIEEDLSYWASEAFITGDTILSGYKTDTNSTRCVASKDGAAVTLTVRNPKAFSFDIPSITASSLIHFNGLAAQPQHGADYTLRQTGPNTLKLTYTQAFLEKNEQGTADLGPTIALKASDGRVFNKAYTFSIKSNSPPPKPKEIVIAKTTETTSHYVFCIQFDTTEMTRTMGTGTVPPVHKDISNITINGSSYTLLYKDDNSDFQKPEGILPIGSFIEHGDVAPLTASSPALPPASEKWVLYFKTEIAVESSNEQTSYTITLSDNKGVVSDSVTAGLKAKFKVEFDVNGGDSTSKPADQYIENGGTVTLPSSNPTRVGFDFGGWYTDNTSYSTRWDFDNNTVTSNMTLYAKWDPSNGTQYKVKHYQQNLNDDGYPASHTDIDNETGTTGQNATVTLKHYTGFKTGTYTATTIAADGSTVVEVRYEREKYAVRFNVDGSAGGSISGTVVTGGSGTSASSVTVKHGGSVTFTASPDTANNWEVEKWTVGGSVVPNHTSRTYTLSNIDGNKNVTVTFKKKFDVTFSVGYGGGGSLKGTYNGTTETTSGMQTIHVWAGGSVEFTALPDTANGWEVQSWMVDSTQVPSHTSETYTLSNVTQPKTVTVIFKKKTHTVTFSVVGGQGGSLTANYGSPHPSTTASSSVQVTHGDSVTFTASPTTGWEVDSWTGVTSTSPSNTTAMLIVTANTTVTVTFKETYTVTFSVVGGHGSLKGEYNGSEETAAGGGQETFTVLDGGSVTFTAKPSARCAVRSWTVSPGNFTSGGTGSETMATLSNITENKTVTVTFFENTIEGGSEGWKKLKKAVQEAPAGGTIIIDGTISATDAPDNNGEIVIDKNLTVKKADSAASAVLDANKNAGGKTEHRIFKVTSGKQLTLDNLTLKGGKANAATDMDEKGNGGAIYAHGTTVKIINCILTDNQARNNGGAVYAVKDGATVAKVEISNSNINKNTVTVNSGFGGGIFINDDCILTLAGTTISENEAARGGGVRANRSTITMTACIIKENKATNGSSLDGGGGVYTNRGTLTMTDNCEIRGNTSHGSAHGGGMIIEGTDVTMKDCTLTGNTAETKGGGVWLKYGTFKMQGSTTVTPDNGTGKNDVYLWDVNAQKDNKITVTGALTHSPAARITPNNYSEDKVVVEGSSAEEANFTVTPNGGEYWRCEKVGNQLKLKKN